MKCSGLVLQILPETPAQQASGEFLRPVKKPPGRPSTTWVGEILEGQKRANINIEIIQHAEVVATDRERWKQLTPKCMESAEL